MRWDTVVIGSGAGGLAAAVALARAGQKVLVLEQHYLPGGWTQSFSLEGYRFSPGVHYIGELGPGGNMRRMYEGLGVGRDLEFVELNPDGFDHLLIAGERMDVPAGLERYVARLGDRFPRERDGISRYFDTVKRLRDDLLRAETLLSFPAVLALPFKTPTLARWGLRTLDALLSDTVRDPLARAMLSAECGNHGLPPARVSLPIHAAMTAHYFDGGYYPRGGAKRIPNAFIRELRRRGGSIRLRARVKQVLVERGRAAGVELEGGERIAADHVVSNADPAVTYGALLPPPYAARERKRAARMEYSTSLMSVFCAVDLDLERMGLDSGNYWYYRTSDVARVQDRMLRELPRGAEVDGLFVTVTSLKDPGHRPNGHHTLEMFTFVPYAPFARWDRGAPDARGDEEYERAKNAIADKMVATAERVIPGITRAIRFRSVGSPVTNRYYCEAPFGAAYGTAKTPWQLGPFSFSARAPVPGLYLCGASTISHGVAGATMSGLLAACAVLGRARPDDVLGPADGSIRLYDPARDAATPGAEPALDDATA